MTKKEEAALKRQERLEKEKQRVAGMREFENNAVLGRLGEEVALAPAS